MAIFSSEPDGREYTYVLCTHVLSLSHGPDKMFILVAHGTRPRNHHTRPHPDAGATTKTTPATTTSPVAPEEKQQQEEKGEGNQEAEESASNVLRRLSSPIFSAGGGFNSDSDDSDHDSGDDDLTKDGDDYDDYDEEEVERKEGAVGVIQHWWRGCRRASKRARAVVAARPAFVRIQQLLDKVHERASVRV